VKAQRLGGRRARHEPAKRAQSQRNSPKSHAEDPNLSRYGVVSG
jgi:hypothetical protein